MAERVKRRVAAARLAVAFVAAGTIAGAAAWAQAGPPPTARSSAFDAFAKVHLDTSNIENHSLKYVDFAKGEVPSFGQYEKLNQSFKKFKKAENNFKVDVNGDLNTIKGELPSYVKMADADARYYKHSEPLVQGDGSVFTASHAASPNSLVGLLNVPNLISVDALAGGAGVRITNIGGSDLNHSDCTLPAGGGSGEGTLKPGETLDCATGDHSEVMQMLGGSGGSQVMTLWLGKIGAQITVQVLVGL
jgi:hypothetical protein